MDAAAQDDGGRGSGRMAQASSAVLPCSAGPRPVAGQAPAAAVDSGRTTTEGDPMGGVITGMREAARLVGDGDQIVYVGYMKDEPVAFFHELLRQGRRDLHLVLAPSSGVVADLMIGAGALADVEFSSLSFMEYGFAPNFRRKAEAGTLRLKEHS